VIKYNIHNVTHVQKLPTNYGFNELFRFLIFFKWKSEMEMNVVGKILAYMFTVYFAFFFYIDKSSVEIKLLVFSNLMTF
jgi:hypothetical protein